MEVMMPTGDTTAAVRVQDVTVVERTEELAAARPCKDLLRAGPQGTQLGHGAGHTLIRVSEGWQCCSATGL